MLFGYQQHHTWIHCLRLDLNVNNVSTYIAYVVYVCDNLQNGAIGRRGGDELLNKVVIFVFFVHKKCSRSFVKLRLNP